MPVTGAEVASGVAQSMPVTGAKVAGGVAQSEPVTGAEVGGGVAPSEPVARAEVGGGVAQSEPVTGAAVGGGVAQSEPAAMDIGMRSAVLGQIGIVEANPSAFGMAPADLASIGVQPMNPSQVGLQQVAVPPPPFMRNGDTFGAESLARSLPQDPSSAEQGGNLLGLFGIQHLSMKLTELAKEAAQLAPSAPAAGAGGSSEPTSKEEKTVEDAYKARSVPTRSAIDSKFRRFLAEEPNEAAKYKKCVGRDAKEAFRLDWVDKEWAKVQTRRIDWHLRSCTTHLGHSIECPLSDARRHGRSERVTIPDDPRSHVKEQSESIEDWGEYRAFEVIAKEESGVGITESGATAALNICLACMKMGTPFVRFDSWSRRMQFLHVKGQHRWRWERKWQEHQEEHGDQGDLLEQFAGVVAGSEGEASTKRRRLTGKTSDTVAAAPSATAAAAEPAASAAGTPASQAAAAPVPAASAPPAAAAGASPADAGQPSMPKAGAAQEAPSAKAKAAAPKAKAGAPKAKAKAAAKAAASSSGGGGGGDGADDRAAAKEAAKELAKEKKKLESEAQAQITAYSSASTQSTLLLSSIATESDWQWANNEINTKKLRAALSELNGLTKAGTFLSQMLFLPFNEVKHDWGEEYFYKHVGPMTQAIRPKVAKVMAEMGRLHSMHASFKAAENAMGDDDH
ncbi:unnamed protein product [Prorocentrum cordatum]|uniref:Uncharacterized protein n=1 Tax=Prorocentrum cordatum TaxID=2364126 RepID=A0ABN9YD19_9DINO|nr:unnamed protein product [Polarella glacialis]